MRDGSIGRDTPGQAEPSDIPPQKAGGASPAFIEAILKAYRMGDQGAHHQGYAEIQSGSEKAPGNNLPDHGHIVNGSSSAET